MERLVGPETPCDFKINKQRLSNIVTRVNSSVRNYCGGQVRRDRVRQLFRMRLSEELTETGVLLFYRWLQKYHPELLLRKKRNDPYQHLRMELEGLWRQKERIVLAPDSQHRRLLHAEIFLELGI